MSEADPIVFVVDDNRSVREAITSLLASIGLRAETFRTAEEFLKAPRPEVPACVVLDVRLPGLSGLDVQRALQTKVDLPIVFITGHGDVPMAVEAMKGGAVEFLLKPFREQQLLDAIQRALARQRSQRQWLAEVGELRRRYESLTQREQQVMMHVVAGLLNKQIAARLHTSEVTVKVHRGRVMRKMHVTSLPELVRAAERLRPSATGVYPADTNV
jgi:FixJ family two-component response regulator